MAAAITTCFSAEATHRCGATAGIFLRQRRQKPGRSSSTASRYALLPPPGTPGRPSDRRRCESGRRWSRATLLDR